MLRRDKKQMKTKQLLLTLIAVGSLLAACGPTATPAEDCDTPAPEEETIGLCLPEGAEALPSAPLAADPLQVPVGPEPVAEIPPSDFELRIPVVAVYGRVESAPQQLSSAATQLVLLNTPDTPLLMTGATGELEAALMALRDSDVPDNQAHIWGELLCTAPQIESCRITVSEIWPTDTSSSTTVTIQDWLGLIYSDAPDNDNDYFTLIGPLNAQYGLQGADEDIQAQIKASRDSGEAIIVSGELIGAVEDWYGVQIIVSHIAPARITPNNLGPLIFWPPPPDWVTDQP